MAYSKKWDAEYKSFKGEGFVTLVDWEILTRLDEESNSFWHGLHLTQGGLSGSVQASANTHLGLGAFDVRTRFNSKDEVWMLASMFLRSGIVFFPRGYIDDSFQDLKHGHCVSRESYASLHPSAKAQYQEYDRGGDGLVGSRSYTGPRTRFERWETSPYNLANIKEDKQTYYVTVKESYLWGLDVDRNKRTTKERSEEIQIERQIKRWGRMNLVTAGGIYYAEDYMSTTKPEEANK